MPVPNFFIVGAPKCGTTSMSRYLGGHPNVFMSDPKEPNFFCVDFPKTRAVTTSRAYRALFAEAEEHHRMVGEASTWYLYSSQAANRIHQFHPGAKIIAMVRNPVELVHSLHSQLVFNGVEEERDFARAWQLQDQRRDRPFVQYGEIGKLAQQIQRFLDIFPRNQVNVIVFDDLVADARSIYLDTLTFLDLPYDGQSEFSAHNQNKRLRSRIVASFIRDTPDWLAAPFFALRDAIGLEKLGVLRGLRSLNTRRAKREDISSDLRTEIANHFAPDVAKLSEILGRDLTHWTNSTAAP